MITSFFRSHVSLPSPTPSQLEAAQREPQAVLPQAQAPEQRTEQPGVLRSAMGSLQKSLLAGWRQNSAAAPAAEAGTASFPTTVAAWEAAIAAQKTRTIDLAQAARVLNEIRVNPNKFESRAGKIPTHAELKGAITPDQVNRWNAALGLTPAQVKAMNNKALIGGTSVPLNNTFFNSVSFALVPMLQYLSKDMKNPWAQAGVGLGIVAVQPLLSSVVQTYAVAFLEVWRQKNAPSVQLDKGTINAKTTPRQLADRIDAVSRELRESGAALERRMRELAPMYIDPAPEAGTALDESHLAQIYNAATTEQKEDLQRLQEENAALLLRLGDLVVDMQKADGGQDRAKHLNAWQVGPRTMRGASRIPAAVLTGPAAGSANNLQPIEISGISVGVAMACQLLQHGFAALDELEGQTHDHKMNMLYADVFTDAAKKDSDLREGKRPIAARDLHEGKLRGLVAMPETQMTKRVAKLIEGRLKEVEDILRSQPAADPANPPTIDLEAGRTSARSELEAERTSARTGLEAGGTPAREDLEAGRTPAREGLEAGGNPALEALEARRDQLRADLKRLQNGELSTLTPKGEAEALVHGVLQRISLGYSVTESNAKMTLMEFTAQLGQRIAQSFTLGVLGSAAAVTLGPVLTAALGGNDKVPNPMKLGIAGINTLVALFSAATQYMVVNVKNNRRDGGEMGFAEQVAQGVISPVIALLDYLASRHGLETAEEAFHENLLLFHNLERLTRKAPQLPPISAVEPLDDNFTMPGGWTDDVPEPSTSVEVPPQIQIEIR